MSRRPSDWQTRKKYVFEREGYQCQNCRETKHVSDLIPHHIVPDSIGGTDKITNLACLCVDCHKLIHKSDVTRGGETALVAAEREGVDYIAIDSVRGSDLDLDVDLDEEADGDRDDAPEHPPPAREREGDLPRQPRGEVTNVVYNAGAMRITLPMALAKRHGIGDGDRVYWQDAGQYIRVERYRE